MYYRETMYMWPIGVPEWWEVKDVKFECRLIGTFANNKIRVGYRIPFKFEDIMPNSTYTVSNHDNAR